MRTHKLLIFTPCSTSVNRPKYVVIPGNNSRAILAAFRRRPWWGPARKEDASAATVVRSSFVSRRKRGGKKNSRDGTGSKVGYRCVCAARIKCFSCEEQKIWPAGCRCKTRARQQHMLFVDEAIGFFRKARNLNAFLCPDNSKTAVLSSAAQACPTSSRSACI